VPCLSTCRGVGLDLSLPSGFVGSMKTKSLNLGDGSKFWRSVKRLSNDGKATKHASCVADVTEDNNIAKMWKNHFAGLYNSVQN